MKERLLKANRNSVEDAPISWLVASYAAAKEV